MKTQTNKVQINRLYNQDIAPQDSQKTSFFYHKTLAIQCFIALFAALSILAALAGYFKPFDALNVDDIKDIILAVTIIMIIGIFFETLSRIDWMREKKDIDQSALNYYLNFSIEILFLIPIPNRWVTGTIEAESARGGTVNLSVDDILTVYVLTRLIYIIKFLVHSELYYGSRPDRLSRLYTVKFGTFNAVKFLTNEKPHLIVIIMLFLNLVCLPLVFLIVQGKINEDLSSFVACIHFVTVSQFTVGYGDLNVITFLGRTLTIGAIMLGITFSSLLLIIFMQMMQASSQEEQAHSLLNSLERRVNLIKARVLRIQNEWILSSSHATPEQMTVKQEKLKKFRFENRQNIRFQRQQSSNLKRMMMSNFSGVIEQISQVKEKQQILARYINVISKAKKLKHNYSQETDKSLTNLDLNASTDPINKKSSTLLWSQ